MHIAEHEHHRKGIALKRNAESMTHGAVRPVAADNIAEEGSFDAATDAPQLDRDLVVALSQHDEFNAAFDRNPEAIEMTGFAHPRSKIERYISPATSELHRH